ATSTLSASVQQADQQSNQQLDIRSLTATASAQVSVGGASHITATGDVLIQATSTDTATASAQAKPTSTNADKDAAFALATLPSSALASLSGQSIVGTKGAFRLNATNTTTLSASADGSAGGTAARGGTFADAELSGTTKASIDGSAAVSAAS